MILWQFIGIAVSGNNRLEYGSNKYTRYTPENAQPNVYDGFLSIPVPPKPGIDFWFAFTFTIYPKSTWELKKKECAAKSGGLLDKIKSKLGIKALDPDIAELAGKAATEIYLKKVRVCVVFIM